MGEYYKIWTIKKWFVRILDSGVEIHNDDPTQAPQQNNNENK